MPTIKHTNKTGETCSQLRFTSASVVPLSPFMPPPPLLTPSLWGRLIRVSCVFFGARGKPFVYFIIVGYLAVAPPLFSLLPSPSAAPSATPFVYGVWRKRLKRNLFSRPRGSRTTTEQQQNPRDSQCDKNASENEAKRMLNQKQQRN